MTRRTISRITVSGVLLVGAGLGWYFTHRPRPATIPQPAHAHVAQKNTTSTSASPTASFNKQQYSQSDPTSIWVVVNKQRPLQPKSYVPADLVTPDLPMRVGGQQLRQVTADAMAKMFAAAKAHGTPLRISSAYRSYSYQVNLYNGYVNSQGKAVADSQSARPGYSEHQTGLAADLSPADGSCSVAPCFASTPAGIWLAAHAYEYGFIIRYPDGHQATTGYIYEPWHVRYVGVVAATEMHTQGVPTLEEFFGLPAAPDYAAN